MRTEKPPFVAPVRVAIFAILLAGLLPQLLTGTYLGREESRLVDLVVAAAPPEEAREDRLAELEPRLASEDRPELWRTKGEILAAEARWEAAEAAFRRAADTDPGARLGLAVTLFKLGRGEEALEELQSTQGLRLSYARVLLTMQVERELDFSELRAELEAILDSDPFFADAFDLWLGLNPSPEELESRREALENRSEVAALWQRAEILLRKGKPKKVLEGLRRIDDAGALAGPIARARSRAHFQRQDDEAGQAAYVSLLKELDEATAELLFRDIAAIVSEAEREEYRGLELSAKARFFDTFWRKRHPVPAQEVNPRLGEHYRRLHRALTDYPLQSNGRGYYTDTEVLLAHSPELPYYDPRLLFEHWSAARYWLDPRGLMLLRHGEPEDSIGPSRYGGNERNESWVLAGYQTRPLVFNFVERSDVGEWVLTLNLAVAATLPTAPDRPDRVAQNLQSGYRLLYQRRMGLHPLYRRVTQTSQVLEALTRESQLMAAFAKASLQFDSTDYYTQENTLPLAVSASRFYHWDQPAVKLDLGVGLEDIDRTKLPEDAVLKATVLFFDRHWEKEEGRLEKTFPLPRGKSEEGGFVATLPITGLEPREYALVVQVYQPRTSRVGVARGRQATLFIPEGVPGMSDLLLFQSAAAGDEGSEDTTASGKETGQTQGPARQEDEGGSDGSPGWLPVPTQTIRKSVPSRIVYELYQLQPDDSGTLSYEVVERVLTLQEKPGLWDRIAGVAQQLGQIFFPAYTFAAEVGAFTIRQATADELAGLDIQERTVEGAGQGTVEEAVQYDFQQLEPGIYAVYVTVRDLNSSARIDRSLVLKVEE